MISSGSYGDGSVIKFREHRIESWELALLTWHLLTRKPAEIL